MSGLSAMRRAHDDWFALDVARRHTDRYPRPPVVHSFYDRTPDAAGIDR